MSNTPSSDPAPEIQTADAGLGAPTPSTATESTKGKAGIVSIAIMCSRVLGLVREIVLGGLFGGSKYMDAFMVAFRTPNMLRDLFAEGALSTAFITTFSKKIKTEGDDSAWDLARKMLTLTTVFMSALTLVSLILLPWIVRIMAIGWTDDPEQIRFTILLSRIIYAFILFLSLAALVMGMLNAKGVFFVPAMASSFFNLGSIASGVAIGYWIDPTWGRDSLIGIAIGVLIGGFMQLAVQWPSLRKIGFRFWPDFQWKDPAVKKVLTLMGPAIIAGSAVQAGVALNTVFASFLEEGSVSYLQWAFRLVQLPIGIFGVAVATVTLPAVSRAATEGISDDFRAILSRGVRLVLLLTVPSAIGLAMLAEPIISVIWERGRFDLKDTLATAAALRCFSIGLIFYAGIKVVQPAFYAIEHKWIPMIVSLIAILVNATLNSIWVFGPDISPELFGTERKGHEFLALSTALGSLINFCLLYLMMWRYARHLHTGQLLSTLVRLGVACLAMIGVIYLGQQTLLADWHALQFPIKPLYLGAVIAAAAIAYFVVAKILRIEELDEIVALVRRRRRAR